MELIARIAVEYTAALRAALPERGLELGPVANGEVCLLEDDTPKDLSEFWDRYDYGVKVLKLAGIVAPWEAELAATIAAIKAKWAV
jgi:hypothetical protein